MKTLNTKYHSQETLKSFIEENTIIKYDEVLLQIFTGNCDENFINEIVQYIKQLLPKINIIGATTDGEIYHDSVSEYETVLSFSIFEETKVLTFYAKGEEDSTLTAKALINQFPKDVKAKVGLAFGDGLTTNGEDFLATLHQYDNSLVLAGGLAGDNATFIKTLVFNENKTLHTGAVIALLYNKDLQVNTKSNFGWQSIGKQLRITKAKDNIVYEIDGLPAVKTYAKYLGEEIAKQLPRTGIEFPLIIHRNGLDIARAVIYKNDDGSLVFAGKVKEGDLVRFGYGNIEAIKQGTQTLYLAQSTIPSESIFIYSCMARKSLMGKEVESELKGLAKFSPLSGFFTYGEFFTDMQSQTTELLNETMTIITLSESKKLPKPIVEDKASKKTPNNLTFMALSHLITQTTRELEETNANLRQKIEEEITLNRQKDRRLLQHTRMAQMGEMISMIAHQWRQPLGAIASTTINIQSKMMLNSFGLKEDKEIQDCQTFLYDKLDNIENYVQSLSTTIDDFRNFYNPNKIKKELLITAPIQQSLNIIKSSLFSKGIEVEEKYHSRKKVSLLDSEIMQVFLNIFKNSQDNFIEKSIQNAKITIETFDINDAIRIEICDNGGGIPEAIMIEIFNPYFSTKTEKNGTGLGLYMSKTIVEEHHKGKLKVQNKNEGACFTITLPLSTKPLALA